jgi:hypothetical protein
VDSKEKTEEELEIELLKTDFPFDDIYKQDYKILNTPGLTFGNDKVISGKKFRPSFALSMGQETQILEIPCKVLEEAIRLLANTGENKEKTDFMKEFIWFYNFT